MDMWVIGDSCKNYHDLSQSKNAFFLWHPRTYIRRRVSMVWLNAILCQLHQQCGYSRLLPLMAFLVSLLCIEQCTKWISYAVGK